MNGDLTVLRKFAKKLSNCRYRISVDNLIDYFKDGKFGFTVSENSRNVVTNEYVFADDVAILVQHLKAIFKEPRVSLKQENVVSNVNNAIQYDSHSLQDTVRDEKLWRVKSGERQPEYVHSYVYEESFVIYENRFICYLVDTLARAVSEKLDELCLTIKNVNGEIAGYNGTVALDIDDYLTYADSAKFPVLASSKDAKVGVIASLLKSKTTLLSFKSSEMYKACCKTSKFTEQDIHATNILEGDKEYNYCYLFFLKYFDKDVAVADELTMYRNFSLVSVLYALDKVGFKADRNNEIISVAKNSDLSFDTIYFKGEMFNAMVNSRGTDIVVTIINNIDDEKAVHLIKVCDDKIVPSNSLDDFTSVTYLSQVTLKGDNVLVMNPSQSTGMLNLAKLIRSFMIVVEGSTFIHTRNCPICGSTLVAPDGDSFECVNCQSLYHLFDYEDKTLIWIKRLPANMTITSKAKEEKAEKPVEKVEVVKVVEEKVEEPIEQPEKQVKAVEAVSEADDEDEENGRSFISRSFTGKMCQAKEETQKYYSEIKNYLLSFKKVRSNVSWNFDNFMRGRESIVKIVVRGKTLVLFFALNPSDYVDTKYFAKDMSDVKKFEGTPTMVKVKSDRGVKFAKELIDKVLGEDAAKIENFEPQEYTFKYMSDSRLIAANLAKPGKM